MGNLMAYSAIVTKIKAMERWRLTDQQFEEMAELENVPEAVAYLKRIPLMRLFFPASVRMTCIGERLSSS